MATVQGVQTASVLDTRDPEELGRVRVRVHGGGETPRAAEAWARVATMMAGENKGTWFIPDVGDEVLVAFQRGDPQLPVVIGALWNAKARPPAAGDPASTKLIRSRSGVTIRLRDDDASGSVTIETPGGQRVTLEDAPGRVRVEDGHGNAITLSPAGIEVQASAKVVVNAASAEISASLLTVQSGMSRFTGVVQCDTLISNSVVSASYTPGAGNVW
jgi:uncharacterized protein involved in type VI secretion and phage assembly